MFIRSERLFLRPGWPEDQGEIFAGIADEAVARHLARLPWPYPPEAAREYAELPQDRRFPHFMITLPTGEGSRLIGCIGLAPHGDEVELGYWVAREYWNRGYATEAARALLSLVRTLGHSRLVSSHFVDNPASGRVLRKIGFCPTGEVRPRFCCARGEDTPAVIHAAVLGQQSDCDGDDAGVMRAA